MNRSGQVFLDANIINFAVAYRDRDVFAWINALYKKIYVHMSVLDELLTNRSKAEEYIKNNNWILFDPDDENLLSEENHLIYEKYEDEVKKGFDRLDEKKKRENRPIKNTNNLGEINSLAAAIFLSADIICSNDYDIREVIHDEGLSVSPNEEEELQLIIQDTIEDFCVLCVENNIASKREVRKFFKFVYSEDDQQKKQRKLNALNSRLV